MSASEDEASGRGRSARTYLGFLVPGVVTTPIGALSCPASALYLDSSLSRSSRLWRRQHSRAVPIRESACCTTSSVSAHPASNRVDNSFGTVSEPILLFH